MKIKTRDEFGGNLLGVCGTAAVDSRQSLSADVVTVEGCISDILALMRHIRWQIPFTGAVMLNELMEVTQPFPNARNLKSLGFADLDGVWTDCLDEREMAKFMSDHYLSLASAKSQVKTIDNYGYYRGVIEKTISQHQIPFQRNDKIEILELGCGSGSATRALLDIFPNAKVTASDFSLSMLQVLKEDLTSRSLIERTRLCQVNAEKLNFPDGSYDLVMGAALLHHLFAPEKTIEGAARVLKKNGCAIFFEPFEVGMKIVSLIYQMALRDWRSYFCHPRFRRNLSRSVNYWQSMTMKDKSDPFFQGADDKWMFTVSHLRKVARESGFSNIEVSSLNSLEKPFEDIIRSHFFNSRVKLPKWFWSIVNEVENSFSESAKMDAFAEGVVVLTK